MNFGSGYNALSDVPKLLAIEITRLDGKVKHIIQNEAGKQASIKIYYAIAAQNEFQITASEAAVGLELYGDYVQQECQQPGSHPNIRRLMNIIADDQCWSVTVIT